LKKKTIILKLLVDGKSKLYSSNLNNIKKFFYKTEDNKITQLLFKRYLLMKAAFYIGPDAFREIKQYRNQLLRDMPCFKTNNKGLEIFNPPNFNKPGLIKYFKKYNNNCSK